MLPQVLESAKRWQIYALAALMLLLFTLAAWQSYRTMDRELTAAALSGRLAVAQLATATLSEKLDRLADIGISLATRVQFRELIAAGEWLEAGVILDDVPNDFPYIDRLFLTDPDGVLMIDVPALAGDVRGRSFAHREWYQGVSENWEPFISPVYTRAAIPRRNVFAVAVPIKNAADDVLGILVLQQELEEFFTWIEGIKLGQDGFIYVVDGQGRLAYHPELPVQTELIDFSQDTAVQKAMQDKAGIDIVENSGGEEEQIAAYILGRHGWAVIARQPAAVAFATRNRQLTQLVIEYAVVFLLGVLILWLITRMLMQQRQLEDDQRVMSKLEDQWAFFRKIIDLDKNMIFAKDREGRFVLVNQATAEVFGSTVDDLIGKTNSDFISAPEWVEQFHKDEQEIMDTLQEKFFPEVKIKDYSGRVRWLQTLVRPMVSEDGKANMVLGVSADITERKRMEDDLRRSIERFEIIARATNDAVWDLDLLTDKIWWSEAFYSLFGYQRGVVDPDLKFWTEHVHPDDRRRVADSLQQAISGTDSYLSKEYRFQCSDGSYAYVFDRGYVMRDENGKAIRMIGSLMDITERREQEHKISRLNRIREVLSEINYTIVRVRDRETLCREACRIAVEHGGLGMAWVGLVDEISQEIRPIAREGADHGYLDVAKFSARENVPEGQNLVSRCVRENKPIVSDDVAITTGIRYRQELLERGFRSFAVLPLSIDGKAIGVFALYSYETDAFDEEEMKLLREMAADISFALDHLEKERRINHLAYYDALTGLPNHDLFIDRLTQELRTKLRKQVHGLVLIDIERFAYINEALGRHAGDIVLKAFAGRLQGILPEEDQVARIAADSFVVLLSGMKSAAEVARFLEDKIIPALSAPVAVDGQQLQIAVKTGVAIAPGDGLDAETLFKNAEAALKNAKQSGAKYRFYAREMNALVAEKLALENKLRQALKNDEFILAYQPKIDLQNNRIAGLEALIRWDSDAGLIPPDKFIPVLEETGLILDVGQWVIKRALLDYQAWLDKGLQPPPIAVNISAIQLRQADFATQIEAVIGGIPDIGSRLELEITETVIMEDLKHNIDKLSKLRSRQIGISIDDFGTGYSSLRYMSKLPVTALKIDRAFIANMIDNQEDAAIVSAIIPLAHSLGLKVIAEGVETVEQRDMLQGLHCDQYQGYLFSPPLFFQHIETMLRNKSSNNHGMN